MNTDKERLDLIEHYLQDKLSDAEVAEREWLLKEDPDFRDAFEKHQLVIEGIKYAGRNELLRAFRKIEEKNYGKGLGRTRSLRKYYIGVAASIGILLLSYVSIQEFYFKTPEKIAASFFEPYPVLVGGATRSAGGEKSSLELAMSLFEGERYIQAIGIFRSLDAPESEELVEFYLANAYQATHNYSESIKIYKQIISENGIFKEQAEWYLALAYLATEELKMAENLLVAMKDSGDNYAENADKVLNSIN